MSPPYGDATVWWHGDAIVWWYHRVVTWWYQRVVTWWCHRVVIPPCGDVVIPPCGDVVIPPCGDVVMPQCGDTTVWWCGDTTVCWRGNTTVWWCGDATVFCVWLERSPTAKSRVWVWFLLYPVILLLLLITFIQRYSLLASRLTAINFSFFSARKIVAHYIFDFDINYYYYLLFCCCCCCCCWSCSIQPFYSQSTCPGLTDVTVCPFGLIPGLLTVIVCLVSYKVY